MNGMSDHKCYWHGEDFASIFGASTKGASWSWGLRGQTGARLAKDESASSPTGGKRSRDRRLGAEGMGVGRGGSLVIFTLPHGNAVSSAGTLVRYGRPRTTVLPAVCDRL